MLYRFKSYLSSRFFRVKYDDNFISCLSLYAVFLMTQFLVFCILAISLTSFHLSPWATTFMLMTRNDATSTSTLFIDKVWLQTLLIYIKTLEHNCSWMTVSWFTVNSSKTEFLIRLALSDHISLLHVLKNFSYLWTSVYPYQTYFWSREWSTIATSIVGNKSDCRSSLNYSLPKHRINSFQQIQNSLALARAAVKTLEYVHIPVLKPLHWLASNKLITSCYLTTAEPIDICTTWSLFNPSE